MLYCAALVTRPACLSYPNLREMPALSCLHYFQAENVAHAIFAQGQIEPVIIATLSLAQWVIMTLQFLQVANICASFIGGG